MTPSSALYNQIRWDDRYDPGRWTLGIEARRPEPKRVALVDFVPGGDIPWHRVLYFEADGVIVWDRRTGTDHMATATVGRRSTKVRLPGPLWTTRPVLAFDGTGWSATTAASDAPDTLRLLTWNVLFHRYDKGALQSDLRWPRQVAAIAASDAWLIALQEVEWPLLAKLLRHPTIRSDFQVVLPGPPRDIGEHGLALLVRGGIAAAGHLSYGAHKGALAVVVDHWSGPLVIATSHFTSDHSTGAAATRTDELATLRQALDAVEATPVVLGDFNDEHPGPNHTLGLRDVGVSEPTFDPARNPLAAIASITGRSRRIDRVLTGPGLQGTHPQLVFTAPDPTTGHPLSDHYGVAVTLSPAASAAATQVPHPATHRTALAWLAPENAQLDAIRAQHDPAHARWPAHINLVYGCVPEHAFPAAVAALSPVLEQHAPFPVQLGPPTVFQSRRHTLIVAEPTPAEPWSALARAIDLLLPGCVRRHAYRPHLTVGRPPATVPPIHGTVRALQLLSRRGAGPMVPRVTLPLGGGPPTWHHPGGPTTVPVEPPERTRAANALIERIIGLLDGHPVHLVGSRALGVPLIDSDIDLVVRASPTHVHARLAAGLPAHTSIRTVEAARSPGLQLVLDDLSVDLAIVDPTLGPDFPEPLKRALSAITDTRALQRAFAPHGSAGRELLSTIRAWSRARGLHARPLGGLPSIGWSVLVAVALADQPATLTPRERLADFFERWAEWDWSQPVSLQGSWPGAPLPMQVSTPSAPFRACSDAVTPTMARLIEAELLRAWEWTVDNAPLASLLAPPPLHQRHAAWAVVTVSQPHHIGRVRGRLRGLLDTLPEAHAWPHAWTSESGHHTAIGLGPTPPDAPTLAHRLAAWRSTVTELAVQVDWHPGGAIEPPVWPRTRSRAALRIG